MLYKDVSYLADPFLCSEGPAACGDEWSAEISSSKVVPLLHTKRTTARNRWCTIELQTQESCFGPGGTGFVQRLLPGEEWNREVAIHLTPQLGFHVRYPSSFTRPFLNDQRGEMYQNHDAGTPIHMTVFLASKKLDTLASSTEWDWI